MKNRKYKKITNINHVRIYLDKGEVAICGNSKKKDKVEYAVFVAGEKEEYAKFNLKVFLDEMNQYGKFSIEDAIEE